MASVIESEMAFWMWPQIAVKLASDWMETMTSAQSVISARMPLIAAAWADPQSANHRELTRMVTEKSAVFGQSQRAISSAQDKIWQASEANAHALGRLSGGGWLGMGEWARMFERNLEIASTLASLPTAALAPVHAKATANARRLRRP
ncbi:hypothetical protein [Novosphingobium sp. ZW T3_23]|uniref:hypothetical protein n=1 Tax=Novosphingobium sp. ZW T3_23 TaxID=3378084 RepID=UPI00385380E3